MESYKQHLYQPVICAIGILLLLTKISHHRNFILHYIDLNPEVKQQTVYQLDTYTINECNILLLYSYLDLFNLRRGGIWEVNDFIYIHILNRRINRLSDL